MYNKEKQVEANKRYLARKKGENVPLQKRGTIKGKRYSSIKHGTVNEYGRYGCRCELCTKASTEHARKFRNPVKNREAVKRNQKANIVFMREAKEKPCTDCGVTYPYYVMQFDHLRDKNFGLAACRSIGKERIKEEISKCEVVCANCHMIRSHKRKFPTA